MPPLPTAARFCVAGILKAAGDRTVGAALDSTDPTGGPATVWTLVNLQANQVTMRKEFAGGKVFAGTFDLGQTIYALIDKVREQATNRTPYEFEWQLFGLIGPAAISSRGRRRPSLALAANLGAVTSPAVASASGAVGGQLTPTYVG